MVSGFDSAKTIGRSFSLAMVVTTRSVNALALVLTPMIAVGLKASMAATKSFVGARSCA
jgi:hypothetical protein